VRFACVWMCVFVTAVCTAVSGPRGPVYRLLTLYAYSPTTQKRVLMRSSRVPMLLPGCRGKKYQAGIPEFQPPRCRKKRTKEGV
jgi:hypothetical protein